MGVHYGPLMPFAVDVTRFAGAPTMLVTVVAYHMRRIRFVPTGFVRGCRPPRHGFVVGGACMLIFV